MNPFRTILPLTTLLVLSAVPAHAQGNTRTSLAGDPRLARPMVISAEGFPVEDLLGRVTAKSAVLLRAGKELAEEKVVVLGPARPLHAVLTDIAKLLNATWTRETRAGKDEWVLARGVAARQYEEKLARSHIDRMAAQLDEQVRALPETPQQLARRPANDRIRRNLSDTRYGGRIATQIYAMLSPRHRETLFQEGRLRIPFAAFTPEQQASLREIYQGRIDEQKMRNEEFMRENPDSSLLVGDQQDLDRYGLEAMVERQGGSARAAIRIGNGEQLSLSNLETGGTLLPPHGDPYTGTPLLPEFALPAPPVVSEAAREIAWADRLRKLAQLTGRPIVSDYYRGMPVTYTLGPYKPPAAALEEPVAALDALCERPGYLWWTSGPTLLFRKRDFFIQRQYEVPDRWLVSMSEKLQKQEGIPTHDDVLRVLELTPRQLSGLNNLVRVHSLDERFDAGLQETLALLRTSPRPLKTPLHVGDLARSVDGTLKGNVGHRFTQFNRLQAQLFDRLEAVQHYPINPEAKGGEFEILVYCPKPMPETTDSGYRHRQVQVSWDLSRMIAPGRGVGSAGRLDVWLPLTVPDDRRDRTRVE